MSWRIALTLGSESGHTGALALTVSTQKMFLMGAAARSLRSGTLASRAIAVRVVGFDSSLLDTWSCEDVRPYFALESLRSPCRRLWCGHGLKYPQISRRGRILRHMPPTRRMNPIYTPGQLPAHRRRSMCRCQRHRLFICRRRTCRRDPRRSMGNQHSTWVSKLQPAIVERRIVGAGSTYPIGNLPPHSERELGITYPGENGTRRFDIFFAARNGFFSESLRLMSIEGVNGGKWTEALQVKPRRQGPPRENRPEVPARA
jgi:hypothetical protein